MTWPALYTNLAINIVAGTIIFLVGLFWPRIPKSYRKIQLRRFFGSDALGDGLSVVYGSLRDSRTLSPNGPTRRYVKLYHDGRTLEINGPAGDIIGAGEIRASSYLISALSRYRKTPVQAITDVEALEVLNRTMVAIGSSASNEISDFIMRQEDNVFFSFGGDDEGSYVEHLPSKKRFRGFVPPFPKDYGIILKLKNQRFPRHYFFVCAGLGEWGSSGAAWYLANYWQSLGKDNELALVLEIEPGSDESATIVFRHGGEEPST